MNISKQEVDFLIRDKLEKKKDINDALEEIANLKQFESDLTIKNREVRKLKGIIERQTKQIESLKLKLLNKKQKNFKVGFELITEEKEIKELKRYSNRVIALLTTEKQIGLSDLSKTCGIHNSQIRNKVLSNLIKDNKIKVEKQKDGRNTIVYLI